MVDHVYSKKALKKVAIYALLKKKSKRGNTVAFGRVSRWRNRSPLLV
jgi:hypothetical protein